MASIRKRGNCWQAQVRRKGCPPINRTFSAKADAVARARQIETEADRRGLAPDLKTLDQLTVGDLLRRNRDEVVPSKRSCKSEAGILNALLTRTLACVTLSNLTPTLLSRYWDERLRSVKPATVVRELGLVRHAMDVASREWGIPLRSNPVAAARMPKLANRRDRRLKEGECECLFAACAQSRNPVIHSLVGFALETGMRRG